MNRPGGLRRRVARWLDSTVDDGFTPEPAGGFKAVGPPPTGPDLGLPGPDTRAAQAWPALCEQFALRILAAAYQTGGQLAAVEADEQDPGRLAQFYRIDHANTRIRRQAENLLVLAGRTVDDAGRQVTSLLDVVRAATSAIEHYPRVRLGVIAHLAVVDFAADDVIRVLTEVLDNAARFSPPTALVTVSAHLTEAGSVLMRVEDSGVGFAPAPLADVNAMLASTAPVAVGSVERHPTGPAGGAAARRRAPDRRTAHRPSRWRYDGDRAAPRRPALRDPVGAGRTGPHPAARPTAPGQRRAEQRPSGQLPSGQRPTGPGSAPAPVSWVRGSRPVGSWARATATGRWCRPTATAR